MAAAPDADKGILLDLQPVPNIGIVSAYNDMLSAHQPLGEYPAMLKDEIRRANAVAQFAGGVPAMCDGVTQGTPGMELSLFSRDVIAQATAIALTHNMFDGVLLLGVCDKIVPGLLMGALHFGHLPCILIPAGPMTSGIRIVKRRRFASYMPLARWGVRPCSPLRPGPTTVPGPARSMERRIPIRC